MEVLKDTDIVCLYIYILSKHFLNHLLRQKKTLESFISMTKLSGNKNIVKINHVECSHVPNTLKLVTYAVLIKKENEIINSYLFEFVCKLSICVY